MDGTAFFATSFIIWLASDHLALGYVDFAPLIAWLTHATRALLGDSLHAIRLLPALAFGAEAALTGFIARELAGRRWGYPSCLRVRLAGSRDSRKRHSPLDEPVRAVILDGLRSIFCSSL